MDAGSEPDRRQDEYIKTPWARSTDFRAGFGQQVFFYIKFQVF
jgi:hypothetical protein